jgi:hypothetical protein
MPPTSRQGNPARARLCTSSCLHETAHEALLDPTASWQPPGSHGRASVQELVLALETAHEALLDPTAKVPERRAEAEDLRRDAARHAALNRTLFAELRAAHAAREGDASEAARRSELDRASPSHAHGVRHVLLSASVARLCEAIAACTGDMSWAAHCTKLDCT